MRFVAVSFTLLLVGLAGAPVAAASTLPDQGDDDRSMRVCVPNTTLCVEKICISTTTICIFCTPGSNPCSLRFD